MYMNPIRQCQSMETGIDRITDCLISAADVTGLALGEVSIHRIPQVVLSNSPALDSTRAEDSLWQEVYTPNSVFVGLPTELGSKVIHKGLMKTASF